MPTDPCDGHETRNVLINDEERHSRWPTVAEVSSSWTIVHGAQNQRTCPDNIEEHGDGHAAEELGQAVKAGQEHRLIQAYITCTMVQE